MSNNDIPYELKERLLGFAERLPEAKRRQFLINTSRDIVSFGARFVLEHKYTIAYGAIGYAVGYILDHATTIAVPGVGTVRPFSHMVALIGLAGASYGFLKDQDVYWLENMLKRNIREALQ